MHSCYTPTKDSVSSAAVQRVDPSPCDGPAPLFFESANTLRDVDSNVLDELAQFRDIQVGGSSTTRREPLLDHKTSGIRKEKRVYHQHTVHLLRNQALRLKRRVRVFEDDSEVLKDYTVSLLVEKERIERDLGNIRAQYSEELARTKQTRLQLQQAEMELNRLKNRFAETERFILALVDLGLDLPILREAVSSVLSDCQAGEDALIDAFQKSTLAKSSSRFKHLSPGADGHRTVDHYLSALDLTISARKELKEKAKVTHFWKMVAKSDPVHADVVTPSPSALDQIQALSTSAPNTPRSSVVDDLVVQLRGTHLERRSGDNLSEARKLGSNSVPARSPHASPPFSFPAREVHSGVLQHAPLSKAVSFATKPLSVPNQSKKVPAREKRTNLFNSSSRSSRDLVSMQSITAHRSMQSFSAAARRLSDPNLSLRLPFPAEEARNLKPSNSHSAISSTAQFASSPMNDVCSQSLPPQRHIKAVSYPYPIPLNSPVQDSGTFLACQALLSLEKLCSVFSNSSNSLGSQDGTEEETKQGLPQNHHNEDDNEFNVSSTAQVGCEETTHEFPDSRDANAKHGPDQNTSSPPVVKHSGNVPVRKTVKWALPSSPDRSSSGSSLSNSSGPVTSSSGAFDSSSETDSSSEVRPLAQGEVRPRSSSSPSSPIRKSALQAAKSTLSKSSRILKPRPKIAVKTTAKLSSPPSIKSRSTSSTVGSSSRRDSSTASTSVKSAPKPSVPPRSPLRPTSPTTSQSRCLAPTFKPRARSASLIPQRTIPQHSEVGLKESNEDEDEEIQVTSLPPTSPSANIRVYDYTKPVMPLKVVKKGSCERSQRRASAGSGSSSSNSNSFMEAIAVALVKEAEAQASSAVSPPVVPTPTPLQRPLRAPRNSAKPRPLSGENHPEPKQGPDLSITASGSTSLTDSANGNDISNIPTKSSINHAPAKRQSGDTIPTSRQVRVKKPASMHVVPPMRTCSLMPPKSLQTPIRRPQAHLQPRPLIKDPRRVKQQQQTHDPAPVAFSQSAPLPTPHASLRKRGNMTAEKREERTLPMSPPPPPLASAATPLPLPLTNPLNPEMDSSFSVDSKTSSSVTMLSPPLSSTTSMLSPPLTPVSSPKSVPSSTFPSSAFRIDTHTSPLAKLRMTILPATALARAVSKSKKVDDSKVRQGAGDKGGRGLREKRSSVQGKSFVNF